jgi:hypothetical protein
MAVAEVRQKALSGINGGPPMQSEAKSNPPYEWIIGETAGIVWQMLHDNGPMSIRQLVQQLKSAGRNRDLVMQAIGWLAREDKLLFEIDKRRRQIRLK